MTAQDIITDMKKRMDGSLNSLKHNLNGLRTGRATASLLDPVKVDVYGSMMPLNQLGTVSAPEPRLIMVQIWDKANSKAAEKAIANSGLGLNPITEGSTIRVPIPDLSEERRKDMVKKADEYTESARVAIRNVRRDGMDSMKKLEKDKNISEDELKTFSETIQKVTDETVKKADELTAIKSKEIMAI